MKLIALLLPLALCAADREWPVNGGPNNIRYTTLAQITPANVARLKVAWAFDSHDSFKDSEMQCESDYRGWGAIRHHAEACAWWR